MIILFWVVTVLFTIVKSRIIHYSSMAWFPVSFLAAYTVYKWDLKFIPYRKWMTIALLFVGGVISIALIALPLFAMNIKSFIPRVKDKFAQAAMEADVTWTGLESLVGVLMILVIIAGVVYLQKQQFQKAAYALFGGTAITVFLASAIIVPKVERYSQGAAVDFLNQRKTKTVMCIR